MGTLDRMKLFLLNVSPGDRSIEEALRSHPERRLITEVVTFKYYHNSKIYLELCVYRLPNDKTVDDILAELDVQRGMEKQTEMTKMKVEIEAAAL